MTVTVIPSGHFQGGRGLTVDPTSGSDVRSLEDILNEVVTDLNTMTGTVTSPFLYKGNIATAAAFPTAALVQTGWLYTVTADVTDNDGTKTNTGQVFLAGQEVAWNGTNWTVVGDTLTNAWQFKGSIANAAAFPPPAATATTGVKDGHVYRVTTGCTDNDGTKTNTGQVFLTGDIIVWRTNAWYIIQKAPSAATPAAVGTAGAGTSGRSSNDDHVHAHGNQLGGTLHSDAVASTSSGFLSGADKAKIDDAVLKADFNAYTILAADTDNTPSPLTIGASTMPARLAAGGIVAATVGQIQTLLGVDAIVDDHVHAKVTALDMKVDESEKSAALSGASGKRFLATHILVKSIVNVGATNADGTINIGTAADGAQIAAAVALTGVGAVDTARMIPIAAHAVPVAGNATLYVNVEAAETGVGTLQLEVTVVGRQI
jgi:hypothetical protein